MNIFYKLLLFVLLIMPTYSIVSADNLLIIGNTEYNISEKENKNINEKIKGLTTKYGTNIDIILLGKDKNNCYKENNYIECLYKNDSNVMGTYTWVINIGIKLSTGKGDVNSFMDQKANNTKSIISEQDMKVFQENTIQYLKKEDYLSAINSFITSFDKHINEKCLQYKELSLKYPNINIVNCKINKLQEKIKEIDTIINNDNKEKNAIKLLEIEKEKRIAAENFKKTTINLFFVIIILGTIITFIYFIVKMIRKRILYSNMNKLHGDIKDTILFVKHNELLLEKDKNNILDELKTIKDDIDKLLGDNIVTQKDYNNILDNKKLLDNLINNKKINDTKINIINSEIDSVKNINL